MKHRIASLLAAYCLIASAEEKIVGGPYAINVTSTTATVGWIVQTGEVQAGDRTAPVLRSEKVSFTRLKPDTTVEYRLPGSDDVSGRFKTPPAGRGDFKFVVYGDTRTRHELHRKIVAAVAKAEPDFLVHTGDLVSDGRETAQWPTFFEISRDLFSKTVFFPVLGNHERNNKRFYEFFDITTPYYSFDWGGAHFSLLNSDVGNVAMSSGERERFWSEQTRWLDEDLAKARTADFRFVAMHHPPFTAVKRRQSVGTPVQSLVPIFQKHGVTAVFTGHDHNYQHHLSNGVRYIVTGGGGAPLYPVDGPLEGITQKVESTEHFVQITVQGATAKIEAIALEGGVIDTIEIAARTAIQQP
jgi:predicted phosphodiesterase